MLEPFGHGNAEPLFISRNVMPEGLRKAGLQHCRGNVRDSQGALMPFIAFGRQPTDFPPPPWNIVYTPHINHFNGVSTPQLRLLDVKNTMSSDC